MKCFIIKDLLPSYIDGLTSRESNVEIEQHLHECCDCRKMHEQMRSNIDASPVSELKKIEPLKKLNKKFRCGIILSTVVTLLVCITAIVGYDLLFNNGWQAKSEDVAISYLYSDAEIRFNISLTHDKRLDVRGNHMENGGAEFVLSEILYAPFTEHSLANPGKYSEKTIRVPCIDEKGNPIDFSSESKIVFKCSDKEIVYSLKEIIDKAVYMGVPVINR